MRTSEHEAIKDALTYCQGIPNNLDIGGLATKIGEAIENAKADRTLKFTNTNDKPVIVAFRLAATGGTPRALRLDPGQSLAWGAVHPVELAVRDFTTLLDEREQIERAVARMS